MSYFCDVGPVFVEAIKSVENNLALAKKAGEYKQADGEWRWFPGRSPEGGLPTLAWGHKLTSREWETKRIDVGNDVTKDFRYGLTDAEVHKVLLQDLRKAESQAEDDWDKYIGADQKMLWNTLPDKYKGVLINLCFNSGSLVKKGKWIWTTVARGIQLKDDTIVTKGMVTSYKRPDGVRVQLTSRAVAIAKALGLPWQTISQKTT